MLEHSTLLIIGLIFGVSFVTVIIGLLRAPADERLDSNEEMLIDQAESNAEQDDQLADLQFLASQAHHRPQPFPPRPRSHFVS